MATTKKTKKPEKRILTHKEADKLFEYVGKARATAWKMSLDDRYTGETRRACKALSLAIEKAANNFPMYKIVDR